MEAEAVSERLIRWVKVLTVRPEPKLSAVTGMAGTSRSKCPTKIDAISTSQRRRGPLTHHHLCVFLLLSCYRTASSLFSSSIVWHSILLPSLTRLIPQGRRSFSFFSPWTRQHCALRSSLQAFNPTVRPNVVLHFPTLPDVVNAPPCRLVHPRSFTTMRKTRRQWLTSDEQKLRMLLRTPQNRLLVQLHPTMPQKRPPPSVSLRPSRR